MQLTRHRLLEALRRDEFRVDYQPKVELASGHVLGAEGLLRWHAADGAIPVGTAELIRAAERHHLIAPIGQRIIEESLGQLDAWRDAGHGDISLAINVSLRQLLDDDFVSVIERAVNPHPVRPEQITLELNETVLNSDSQHVEQQLRGLRRLGFRLALDGIHHGEPSIIEALELPFNEIKVDEHFIGRRLTSAASNRRLARLAEQSARYGKELVAARVETRGIHEAARQLGCRYGQGFYYGRPANSTAFHGILTDQAGGFR